MSDDPDKTNVLIVDDLPEKILVYRTILEDLGQNLVVARSGEEALREVLRHEFAVILLDIQMPGIDGFETAALIRRRKKSAHTPIIFITAFGDEVRQAEGYAQGAVDYILAPVVPEILRAKVRVFVDLFRMNQQVKRQAEERIALAEERTKREAAEEANRRLAFLAGAAGVLGQSLDVLVTARDVARVAVPFLADSAALVLTEPPAGASGVALAAADGDTVRVSDLPGRDGLPGRLAEAVERTLEREAANDGPLVFALPLRTRGRIVAALALSREASGREFGPVDRATADALASRAAIALDNARLYREVQQADRQKNEFLSMLAHELRNPLAPIRNAIEVMKLRGELPYELGWARDVIDRQMRQLSRLVDDLLDVSRITRGKIELRKQSIELGSVVLQAVEASRPFIESKRHDLTVSVPDEPIPVDGDSARLAQVLTNLLVNAAKYTEEGGRIWLTARRDGREAVLAVRDTGVGIPPEMLAAVFDLFIQVEQSIDRSQGGLGVGLTLVKRLVEMHGGSVSATSDGAGGGASSSSACRSWTRPRRPRPCPTGRRPPRSNRCGSSWWTTTRTRPTRWPPCCSSKGTRCGWPTTGRPPWRRPTASARTRSSWTSACPAWTGSRWPGGCAGRNGGSKPVLVAVSGYGRDEDRRRSRQAGFDHHLVKPAEIGTLTSLLTAPAGNS